MIEGCSYLPSTSNKDRQHSEKRGNLSLLLNIYVICQQYVRSLEHNVNNTCEVLNIET